MLHLLRHSDIEYITDLMHIKYTWLAMCICRERTTDLRKHRSIALSPIDRAALSMYRFVDLCVATVACTNSVNYICRENSRKMNAKLKRRHYYSMQNPSVYVLSLLTIIPHPTPIFQLGS